MSSINFPELTRNLVGYITNYANALTKGFDGSIYIFGFFTLKSNNQIDLGVRNNLNKITKIIFYYLKKLIVNTCS